MTGDGKPGTTFLKIIDPDEGKPYLKPFVVLLARYDAGIGHFLQTHLRLRKVGPEAVQLVSSAE